jgi:hypothetical protein
VAAIHDERRNPFVWFAAAGVVIVVLVLGGIGLRLFGFGSRPVETTTSTPAPASTGAASSSAHIGPPTLAADTPLLAAPSSEARAVARAFQGTPVRLAGRLEDGSWYVVEIVGRIDALGWVPVTALAPFDPAGVPVVTAPGVGAIVPSSSAAADLPNLVLEALLVRRNRVVAVLSNDGYLDLDGPFTLTVGSGAAQRIDLPGKALRPGDRIESVIEGEYVQRRASVVAVVATTAREETLDDNRLETTIEPDVPNDLEVLTATSTPALAVTVRNNSPIPLVGTINVTVRETRPSTRLITRLADVSLKIDAGGTQVFPFPALTGLDLTRTLVLIDTTAINDPNLENDVYPR